METLHAWSENVVSRITALLISEEGNESWIPRFPLSNTSTVSAQTLLTTIQTGGKAVSEGQVMGTPLIKALCAYSCVCV